MEVKRNTENGGPTLTSVTQMGRNVVKYGLIFLAVMMVGRVVLSGSIAIWRALNPEPPPPPTVGFGILPPISFPSQGSGDKPVSYRLETATGTLPSFSDRAKVFFMPKKSIGLLADQTARNIASQYGYVFEPEVLATETYRWNKSQPLISTFELDTRTHQFSVKTNFLSTPELLVNPKPPTGFQAVDAVRQYLNRADLLPADVATASGEVVFLKALGGELGTAVSQSDADFIQVDLNRMPIDGIYRMYTPEGYTGTISAIISGALTGIDRIVELKYRYNEVDYEQVHTYPLRPVQSAWQILQAGEGYIADVGSSEQAIIRTVSLGYYDSFEEQDYLQPVYVFTNDDTGFLGYVPALDPRYIQ
jgi:hypothetical protein